MRGRLSITLILFMLSMLCAKAESVVCNAPLLTNIDSITQESFKLKWLDFNGDVLGWEIEYGISGFSQTFESTVPLITSKSYTVLGLDTGKSYDVYLRTKCSNIEQSNWNGPFKIRTALSNNGGCLLELDIDDNNCPKTEDFLIEVTEYPESELGSDVFIQSVELIIEHDWPADLKISLRSPEGSSAVLSANRGIGLDNYGNPRDSMCHETVLFSDFACQSILNITTEEIIGSYLPEEPLSNLYNNSGVNGFWSLVICDRAADDIGQIKYVKINFSPVICNAPTAIAATNISDNEVDIMWSPPENCRVAIINVVKAGQAPGTGIEIFTSCQVGIFQVGGLESETAYDIYIKSDCNDVTSAFSCPARFVTACKQVTLSSSFDDLSLCEQSCLDSCLLINSVWKNLKNEDDQDWIVSEGSTPTEQTGPIGDIINQGKYIYLENSIELCGGKKSAILETECIYIPSQEGDCDMSFFYHMYGEDIDSLELLISTDNGRNWELLFSAFGNQNNGWLRTFVDLSIYRKKLCKLRFKAKTGKGDRSDIALDQIEFYGAEMILDLPIFYFDQDNDFYGAQDSIVSICLNNPPQHFATNGDDCDDGDPNINPGAVEIPCNAIDENCNGQSDDILISNPIVVSRVELLNETCPGSKDGNITLQISGGIPPYNITWNNGGTGQSLDNISDGVYFAEIQDAGSCKIQTEFYDIDVENSPVLFLNAINNAQCDKSNGSVEIEVAGGQGPYSFLWSNGSDEEDLLNVPEGIYSVLISDQNGCTIKSKDYTIISSPRFTAGIQLKKDLRCKEDQNGILFVGVLNALPPVKYIWSNGDSTARIDNLKEGNYSVTISDARGCDEIIRTSIAAPENLASIITGIENISCFGEADGSIEVTTSGGNAPFDFTWNAVDGRTLENSKIEDISSLDTGSYFLVVSDSKGCKDTTQSITLRNPEPISIAIDSIKNVDCSLSNNGFLSVIAMGGNGSFEYFWSFGEKGSFLDTIPSGQYSVRVIDHLGCKAGTNNLIVGSDNIPLTLSVDLVEINLCPDDSIGVLSVNIENSALLPIDYNWNSGRQLIKNVFSDTISNLPSGKYSVTATDSEGCVGIFSNLIIPEIEEFSFNQIEIVPNECNESENGKILISASGGTTPYSFLWNNGSTASNLENLPNGLFSLTITDHNGCKIQTEELIIRTRNPIAISSTITHAGGAFNNGRIRLDISGGLAPYSVDWKNLSDDNFDHKNLFPGEYCGTIIDQNECMEDFCIVIDNTNSNLEIEPSLIKIFPNPSKGQLFISSPIRLVRYSILDMNGKTIQESDLSRNNLHYIDTSKIHKGLYILQMFTNTAVVSKKVIILQD